MLNQILAEAKAEVERGQAATVAGIKAMLAADREADRRRLLRSLRPAGGPPLLTRVRPNPTMTTFTLIEIRGTPR